jgi:hypothetical protein
MSLIYHSMSRFVNSLQFDLVYTLVGVFKIILNEIGLPVHVQDTFLGKLANVIMPASRQMQACPKRFQCLFCQCGVHSSTLKR